MPSISRALFAAAALAGGASAYQWSQTGGGSFRSNLWPPPLNDPAPPISAEEAASAASAAAAANGDAAAAAAAPGAGANLRAAAAAELPAHFSIKEAIERARTPEALAAYPPVTRMTNLLYELQSDFLLSKTPAVTVTNNGAVILLTDDCVLVALPPPDLANTVWQMGSEVWLSTQAVNKSMHARCVDVVLDENDNIYHSVRLDNMDRAYLYGYTTAGFSFPPTQMWSPVDLGGDMRLFAFYTIGLLYTKGEVWVPMNGMNGVGLTIVKTSNGQTIDVTMGPTGHEGVTGSLKIPNSNIGGDDYAAFVIAHENDARGTFMYAYDDTGNQKWTTQGAQVFTDIDQPHPILDPFTGRIYAIAFEGQGADYRIAIYCFFRTTGSTCPYPYTNQGVEITDSFGGFTTSWIYAGAILSNDDTRTVDRLIYSFPLTLAANEPLGCLIAIAPTSGRVMDSYCVPRDPASPIAAENYIATAPLIALNARGQGQHNVYVALWDSTVVAFDPYNLAQGPIFRVFPNSVKREATISSDFLSMTAGGSLLFPVWQDDDNRFGVVAIPGINRMAPTNGGAAAAASSSGLSSGGAAAVSLVVLGIVGAMVAFPVYRAGGINNALEKYAGVKGGVRSFSVPSGFSSLLGGGASYKPVGFSSSAAGSSSSAASSAPPAFSGGYNSGGYNSIGSSAATDL